MRGIHGGRHGVSPENGMREELATSTNKTATPQVCGCAFGPGVLLCSVDCVFP
jgi:hypothetical protein